jgi:7-cyano-7-deazaguanine synthase
MEVQPIHVNYGQAAELTEWSFCKTIAKKLKLNNPLKIDAELKHVFSKHCLISGKTKNHKKGFLKKFAEEFFPNRNLFILTIASIYCYQNQINTIALGIIDGGSFSYSDTDYAFLKKANRLFNHTLDINIEAPLIKWDKQKVAQYLKKNKFDLCNTYSCNIKPNIPCGRCAACLERNAVLKK